MLNIFYNSSLTLLFYYKVTVPVRAVMTCDICGKIYSTYRSLCCHKQKWHGPHEVCIHCNKRIPKGYEMKRHLLLHEIPKFKCAFEGCNKIFKQKSNLKRHICETHASGERIQCPNCNNSFKNLRALNFHLDTQHPEWKWCCKDPNCTFETDQKVRILVHYNSHHFINNQKMIEIIRAIKAGKIKYSQLQF